MPEVRVTRSLIDRMINELKAVLDDISTKPAAPFQDMICDPETGIVTVQVKPLAPPFALLREDINPGALEELVYLALLDAMTGEDPEVSEK